MTDTEAGRRIVVYVVLATISISVVVILMYIDANGFAGFPQRLVRLGLTIALGVFLIRGETWARQVAVVLYGAAAIFSTVAALQLVLIAPIKAAPLILMAIVYGTSVGVLLMVPSVRDHFEPTHGN